MRLPGCVDVDVLDVVDVVVADGAGVPVCGAIVDVAAAEGDCVDLGTGVTRVVEGVSDAGVSVAGGVAVIGGDEVSDTVGC